MKRHVADKSTIARAARDGLSVAALHRETGIPESTIKNAAKRYGMKLASNARFQSARNELPAVISAMATDADRVEFLLELVMTIVPPISDWVRWKDVNGSLSPQQCKLCEVLYARRGEIVEADTVKRQIWPPHLNPDEVPDDPASVLKAQVCFIRKKLPPHIRIQTVHGVGLRMDVTGVIFM